LRSLEARCSRRWILCGLVAVGLFLGGCRSAPDLETPPEIQYGEDTCDHCRMQIAGPRFAAASMTRQGRSHRFDDIGDMLAFHGSYPDVVARFWVHDHDTESWIPADDAFFAVSKDITTPMGHGVAALSTEVRARELVAESDGVVLTLHELLAIVGRKDPKPGPLYDLVRRAGS